MIKNKYDHFGFPDDCTYVLDPKGMKITYSYDLRDIHDMLEIYLEALYGVKPNNFKFAVNPASITVRDIEWYLPDNIKILMEYLGIEDLDQARELHKNGELYEMIRKYLDENEAPLDDLRVGSFEYEYVFEENVFLAKEIKWVDSEDVATK